MGQRHQIFLKINNPIKGKRVTENKEELKRARKIFGNAKHTIIVLHHQWLYGRSAVVMLLNFLNITNKENLGSNNPFNFEDYYFDSVDNYIEKIMMLLQVQTNLLMPRGIGIERMLFLNENEPYMRENFTCGDNNDGVMIVDTIERKYCFMNIYEQEKDRNKYSSVSVAPQLIPITGRAYMKCYYTEKTEYLQKYYSEGKTEKELDEMAHENQVGNIEIEKALTVALGGASSGNLLTITEMKKIFPKYYKELKKDLI